MSKVGNVENMYGLQTTLVTTNASGNRMLNDTTSSFITSSLIVASPVNEDDIDLGIPSLLITDFEGKPLRLTYTMKPGSGLITDQTNPDIIRMSINNKMLKTGNNGEIYNYPEGEMYVYALGLIPEKTPLFVNGENEIDLDVTKLADDNHIKPVAASVVNPNDPDNYWQTVLTVNPSSFIDHYHIVAGIDEESSKRNAYQNQFLKLNLTNISDSDTLTVIDDDKDNSLKHLKVVTTKLDVATETTLGVVKFDKSTIQMNRNQQLYVETSRLTKISTNGGPGILDLPAQNANNEIFYGDKGRLKMKTKFMPKAGNSSEITPSNSSETNGYGVVLADGRTIRSSQIGILSVITDALDRPKGNSCGVVRADQNTINEKDGLLKVVTTALGDCTSTSKGVCMIDNKTIRKNTSGQLYVYYHDSTQSQIKNLQDSVASLNQMLTSLRNDFIEFQKQVTNTEVSSFSITNKSNTDINILNIYLPYKSLIFSVSTGGYNNLSSQSSTIYGSAQVDTANLIPMNINYAVGYKFKFVIAQSAIDNYVSIDSIVIDGKSYSLNQYIQLSNKKSSIVFKLSVNPSIRNNIKKNSVKDSIFFINIVNSNNKLIHGLTLNVRISYTEGSNSAYASINAPLSIDGLVPGTVDGVIASGSQSTNTGNRATLEDVVRGVAGTSQAVFGNTVDLGKPFVSTK